MFQCKIWSFGRSKSAKNHSISVNCASRAPPISTSALPRVTPASTSPLKRPRCRVDRQVHFRFSVPLPFPVRSSQWSRASRRSPPAFVPAKLAAPSRFPAPQPSSPHPAPPTPYPEPEFAVPRPESHPQRPAAINLNLGAPPRSSTSTLRPSSGRLKVPVSFPKPYSSPPSLSPRKSLTVAGGTPPRAASARSRGVPPRTPGSPGPLAAGAPYLRRRLATAGPDRRAATALLRVRRRRPALHHRPRVS